MKYLAYLVITISVFACQEVEPNCSDKPIVTTLEIIDVYVQTLAFADCDIYIADEGSAKVISRGVCWSTSENPTIADGKTIAHSGGVGFFTCHISNLEKHTVYHVRAYATNCAGTNYGNQLTFVTPDTIF